MAAVPTLSRSARGGSYWPDQAWRDAAACFVVLAVVVGLSVRHGFSTPQAGIELGAPANLVDDPGTARPEWSFRGLYQLHETLSGWPEMVSIFVIPGLTVLVFFAMPWIGRNVVGRTLNIAVTLFVLGGLAALPGSRMRTTRRTTSISLRSRPARNRLSGSRSWLCNPVQKARSRQPTRQKCLRQARRFRSAGH